MSELVQGLMLVVYGFLVFCITRVVSLGLVCVSIGEVSVHFDILLDDAFFICVLVEFYQ